VAEAPATTLAFAGAGWIAAVHGYAIAQVPGLRVVAVASRDPQRAAATAQLVRGQPCTYEELPAGADGVIVCTPPARHALDALHAVRAGAGVLIEKPLCATLEEADELVAAEAEGAVVAYAENLVHAPAVRLAVDHTAQIQPIDVLEVRAIQPRPTRGDFLTEGWGGGVLFDLGVHPLAVALLLASPAAPVEVRATLEGAPDHPVDEHADLLLAFDSGLVARVVTSWRGSDEPVWDAQASSPHGVVRLELLPGVLLERDGIEVPLPPTPEGMVPQLDELGYRDQMAAFAADLAAGTRPVVGAAFGRRVLDVVCGAYQSAGRGGAWVDLPYDGPRDRTPLQLWRGG
jgi:predicted dehydrogenase